MQTLLVTVDALRADHLGQLGYERDTMPALDAISDDGRLYTQAFANGAHTQLSVPSILTGMYDGLRAAREGPTVATALRDAGVATMGIHSNTVLSRDFPTIAGFEDLHDVTGDPAAPDADGSSPAETDKRLRDDVGAVLERSTNALLDRLRPYLGDYEWAVRLRQAFVPDAFIHEPTPYADAALVTDTVLEWVEAHADEPFFAWVHYMDPHRPYGYSLADPAYVDEAPSYDAITELMAKAGVSPDRVSDAERRTIVDLYDSDLRYLSRELERLFDGLADRGIWEDATVVLTADHGEEFGEHGKYYHRNRPYDELIHVPLAIRGPGVEPGRCVGQRELIDVVPTVLDAHDVPIPVEVDGRGLAAGNDRTVVSTASRSEFSVGVRADGHKYIETEDGETELYDLAADPGEQSSIQSERPDTTARLSDAIPDSVWDLPGSIEALEQPEQVDEAVEERLADLGYLE